MIAPQFGLAVEYVNDIEAAKLFYTGVLGLKPERVNPTYVQFEHFAIASDAPLSGNEERELYWLVDDANASYGELPESAEVTLPLKQMPFGKVYGVKGPRGRSCFVLELAQDRPSEAV